METYSRGWRGAPAKGVGRETGARVQISLSPPFEINSTKVEFFNFIKKLIQTKRIMTTHYPFLLLHYLLPKN